MPFFVGVLASAGIVAAAADPFFPAGSDALLQVLRGLPLCPAFARLLRTMVQGVAAKVKQISFDPQAEAATVAQMVASARNGACWYSVCACA